MAQTREFVLGMLVGAAVGAAVAILYAPQSGPETREFLKEKAGEVKDRTVAAVDSTKAKAKDVAGDVASGAQHLVERGRQRVDAEVSAVKAAVDAGKQAYHQKSTELHEQVEADAGDSAAGSTPA